MQPKVIVLELNEVPDSVIEHYIAAKPRSNFAKIYPRSASFVAATPDTLKLHPKISWQTFHRGVADTEHGLLEYNQTEAPGKQHYPPVWELMAKAGRTIGVGASIGSYPMPQNQDNIAFYLTDPFAPTFETSPEYLGAFQQFNNLAVQQSGRNVRSAGVAKQVIVRFLANLPKLGFHPKTLYKVARQLVTERINKPRIVRRRSIQALMSFDVVMTQIIRQKPDFTTLFSNHVASSMHRYWAATFQDDYVVNNMPKDWRDTYGGEIHAAMDEADYMLGRLHKFAEKNPEYSVVVLASMGQEAIEHEVIHNQLVISDMDKFMAMAGISADSYSKLTGMEPEYVAKFNHAGLLAQFETACSQLQINGMTPYVKPLNDTECSFQVFQNNIDIDHVVNAGQNVSLSESGLAIESIQDMSGSTAQHIPGGCCFVFNGSDDLSSWSDRDVEYDLTGVTASLLHAMDAKVPNYMPEPIRPLVGALKNKEAHPDTMIKKERPVTQRKVERKQLATSE